MHANKIHKDFERGIRSLVTEALDRLAHVPGFYFRIRGIKFVPSRSSISGGVFTEVRVSIETNNRPLLLGQFMGFPVNGLRGYHLNYIHGFIRGYFKAKYQLDLLDNYGITIDVHETSDAISELYRYVYLDTAVKEGIVSVYSPLYAKLKAYGLKYVLMSGPIFSGPSLAMIKSIEVLSKQYRVFRVLDLFSGTCALTKVALSNGASFATCVDTNLDSSVLKENLGQQAQSCKFSEADAFHYQIDETYDLAILDPFYEFCLDALNDLLPSLVKRCNIVLVNVGPEGESYWTSKMINFLHQYCVKVWSYTDGGEVIAVCMRKENGGDSH